MSNPTKEVREYLSKIGIEGGKKGGAAGKGTELRRELNRKAAKARWDKQKKGNK
jgi:hypothetical protein